MFGRIMPAPFAMPVNVTVVPAMSSSARHSLRHRVGRHDGLRRLQPVILLEPTDRLRQSCDQPLDWQRLHDHAG